MVFLSFLEIFIELPHLSGIVEDSFKSGKILWSINLENGYISVSRGDDNSPTVETTTFKS